MTRRSTRSRARGPILITAVRAFEEAIRLVRALTGASRAPVTFDGRFYQVAQVEAAPVATPPIWTGATGTRALSITGRLADGWIPGYGSDWLSDRYRWSRPLIDSDVKVRAAGGSVPAAARFALPG